ncbi:MAG: SDR family NAD(P)-dependent oxidoreductase [Bacteroidota bacterium]
MEAPIAFVTGAEGFIGSHLTSSLIRAGYRVKALVQYNSFQSNGWLKQLSKEEMQAVEIVWGDVRDAALIHASVQGVSQIFHLAALVSIPYSYQAAQSFVDVNISGTLNVLEAAKHAHVSRTLIISTSEVYGTAQYVPIDEAHPLQPQSPYSASKIGGESLALAYHRSYELPLTVVRPFNNFGPRQSTRAIIPTIITQLLSGSKELVLGDLRPTRDFVFVKDTATALLAIAQCDELIGEVVNIASGKDISMGELAHLLIEKIQADVSVMQDPQRIRPSASEVLRLCGDATRLHKTTGWKPNFSLSKGLDVCIDWYRKPENLTLFPKGYFV